MSVDAKSAHDCEKDVGHRRIGGADHVTISLQRPVSLARKKQRQEPVPMHVRVTHRASVEYEGVIEEVAVPVLRSLQIVDKLGRLADMILIQPGEFLNSFR